MSKNYRFNHSDRLLFILRKTVERLEHEKRLTSMDSKMQDGVSSVKQNWGRLKTKIDGCSHIE